jgi:signal transduction histidine kinase
MNAAICMLFLTDEEKGRVDLKQCYGIEHITNAHYRLGEMTTGKVAQTGVPIYNEKAEEYLGKYDQKILKGLKEKYGEQTKITSFMIAPIIIQDDSPVRKDKIIGVLKVINKRPDHLHFDAYDLSLFEIFASQISVAMVMSERNRALFKLTQGVGHEIENSVNLIVPDAKGSKLALNSFAPVFQKGEAVTDDMREEYGYLKERVANIYESAEEARDFTQDLLGFSDSKFKKRKRININTLIKREVTKFVNHPPPSIKNKEQVKLEIETATEPMVCSIYEIPFIHIVRNIVANAYQAMQDKASGSLLIKAYLKEYEGENDRKTACIDFTDTGKGIKASWLNKVYDPDFSKRKGGNGLGLWLVKLSLLRMDAAISVKSVVNEGTTFTVELPLYNRRPTGAVADEEGKKSSGSR